MPDLYVGVDIGKKRHVAALLSHDLLIRHKRFQDCPTLALEQSRISFDAFLATLAALATPEHTHVLLERTGHYGSALEQFLHEHGVAVYRIHVQEHLSKQKSDKRDAQALAVQLYNQVELHIPVLNKSQRVHRLAAPNPTAVLLRGLVQHRIELTREIARRKNKLIAIADELFPELTSAYRDPNNPSALRLRTAYPTPAAVAAATLDDLCATRVLYQPGRKRLARLQELAASTIGTKDASRITSLTLEQSQLITELGLLTQHVDALDRELDQALIASREGQILLSFPAVGIVHAATLIAFLGSIANFPRETDFRAYCGWTPRQFQSGDSFDYSSLKKSGHMLLKQTVYLITIAAIHTKGSRWKTLYDRLVPRMCWYDARLKKWRGRMKAIGRVAGQMTGVMYTLLKGDYDTLAAFAPGEDIPPPVLYDPAKHHIGRDTFGSTHETPPSRPEPEQQQAGGEGEPFL